MKKLFLIMILTGAFLLASCGKKNKPVVNPVSDTTKAAAQTTEQSEQETKPERTEYVRLEVVNKGEGIEVRILDDKNARILNEPFTVCIVKANGSLLLDKTLSATIEGDEYDDDDGDGSVYIEELDSGSYEIYLRPMDLYMDANPIPLSFVVYKYDENIIDKIKQQEDVDVQREDKSYVSGEEKPNVKSDNAIKVSNMINAGFIRGTSERFEVNMPVLTEDGEIRYEKLNAVPADSSISGEEYEKDYNKKELLIGGVVRTGYVYEEERFDPRVDEYYVSKALIEDDGVLYLYSLVPHMTTGVEDVYVGWYSKKGKHYYNNKDGYPVTGWVKLDGLWYYFDKDGQKASVTGVDVSEYQENIDFEALKNAGIDFAIIRCGYRGWTTGVLVEDARFRENIEKAEAAGMPYGVYIFSQAVSPSEAAEEASMIMELCKGYTPDLPYAIDIEACGTADDPGRQNLLTSQERTQIVNTFANVISTYGNEPMLYSNKRWLQDNMNLSQISCKIWYAMWPGEDEEDTGENPNNDALEPDPDKIPDMDVEIWQYSSKGQVDGIETLVDLNAWVPSLE